MTMHATVPDTHMNFVIIVHIFFLHEYKQLVQRAERTVYKSNSQPMCHRPPSRAHRNYPKGSKFRITKIHL